MIRRPPRSTRTDTLVPYTTLFRSKNHALIRQACGQRDFEAICAAIAAWADHEDPWLKRAATTFKAGSPGSARLSYSLLQRVQLLSLAEVFRQEYIVSLQCGVHGRSEEHTSELQSLMRISYAVFCLNNIKYTMNN